MKIIKTKEESIQYLSGLLFACEGICNRYFTVNLWVTFEFYHLYNSDLKPVVDENRKTIVYKNYYTKMDGSGEDIGGEIVKYTDWKKITYDRLSKWIDLRGKGDTGEEYYYTTKILLEKILDEIANIIPNEFNFYEVEYNSSGYIWCDGFELIWYNGNNSYVLRLALHD